MRLDKPISHPSHPQHRLKREVTKKPFRCDGCKEPGIGPKYQCRECNFDLHEKCAVPPSTLKHPFYNKCEFRLHNDPPSTAKRTCDACRKGFGGFVFHCDHCELVLHPCCAQLQPSIHDGDVKFHLHKKKLLRSCESCHYKEPGWWSFKRWFQNEGIGWSYRSECKSYYLHVACAKELLAANWDALQQNVNLSELREMQRRIPRMEVTLRNKHRARGNLSRYCDIAVAAVRLTVSALLGDPTAMIEVMGNFIRSRHRLKPALRGTSVQAAITAGGTHRLITPPPDIVKKKKRGKAQAPGAEPSVQRPAPSSS